MELKLILSDHNPSRLFYSGGLVLGSGRQRDQKGQDQVWLLMANERAAEAYLLGSGRGRLSVEFPHPDPRHGRETVFIQYSHSDIFGPRLGHVQVANPPPPLAPSDYVATPALRIGEAKVLSQLLKLLAEDLTDIAKLFRQGRLARSDLLAGNLSLCRGLSVENEQIVQSIDQKVNELELASTPLKMFLRAPASAEP